MSVQPRENYCAHFAFLLFSFLFLFVAPIEVEADVLNKCTSILRKSVSILWFPRSPTAGDAVSHIKIVVEGRVYNTFHGTRDEAAFATMKRLTNFNSYGRGFYEFPLLLKPGDVDKLGEFLRGNPSLWGACSEGACFALRRNTNFNVPVVFSILPATLAAYLTTLRLVQGNEGPVGAIQYYGRSRFKSMWSLQIPTELMLWPFTIPISVLRTIHSLKMDKSL